MWPNTWQIFINTPFVVEQNLYFLIWGIGFMLSTASKHLLIFYLLDRSKRSYVKKKNNPSLLHQLCSGWYLPAVIFLYSFMSGLSILCLFGLFAHLALFLLHILCNEIKTCFQLFINYKTNKQRCTRNFPTDMEAS